MNVTVIDFLSIDTEGNDYDILLSNDWLKYRPKVIVVEYITYVEGNRSKNKQIKALLENVGYFLFCLSVTNAFFLEKNYSLERFGINKNYLTIEE